MVSLNKLWPTISAYIGIFLFGIAIITLGSLLPYLTEKFSLSETQGGIVASMLAFGLLAGSVIFGPLVDRYSYKIPLITAALLISIGMELIVINHSILTLYLSFLTIGFGGGMMNGITSALINELTGTDQKKRSANLSILGMFYGLGALATPALLRILLEQFTHEQIFRSVGFLVLLPILLFIYTSFPEMKVKISFSFSRWAKMLRNPLLFLFSLVGFFQGSLESLTNNWTTTFLPYHASLSAQTSLIILSVFMLSYTLARLLLGWLFNKISSPGIISISIVMVSGGLVITGITTSLPCMFIAFILIGLGLAAGIPMILGYVGVMYITASGTAFSIILTFTLTGNIITNYGMGLLSQQYSINIFPWYQLVLLSIMAVLLYFSLKLMAKPSKK